MWRALWSIWCAPLDIFSIKNLYTDSQPFDLYTCFFLTLEYWRLYFSSLCCLFFFLLPDLSVFSVSGGSFKLKFGVRSRCDGCCLPFLPQDLQWSQMKSEIPFPPCGAQEGAVMPKIQHRFKCTQGIQWMPSLLFLDSLFCLPFFLKSAFLLESAFLDLTKCKFSKITCYSKPELIPVKTCVCCFIGFF